MSLVLKTARVCHYFHYLTPRGALSPTHDIHIGQVRFILSFRNPLTLSLQASRRHDKNRFVIQPTFYIIIISRPHGTAHKYYKCTT